MICIRFIRFAQYYESYLNIESPLWKRFLCVQAPSRNSEPSWTPRSLFGVHHKKNKNQNLHRIKCVERHNSLQSFPQEQCINLPPFLWSSNTLEPPHNFEGQPLSVVRNASWNVQSLSPQHSLKPPLTVRLLRVRLEHLHVLVDMLKSPSKAGSRVPTGCSKNEVVQCQQ